MVKGASGRPRARRVPGRARSGHRSSLAEWGELAREGIEDGIGRGVGRSWLAIPRRGGSCADHFLSPESHPRTLIEASSYQGGTENGPEWAV